MDKAASRIRLLLKCNSTLPPWGAYSFDNQKIIDGGIIGGIRVELREVPP